MRGTPSQVRGKAIPHEVQLAAGVMFVALVGSFADVLTELFLMFEVCGLLEAFIVSTSK